MRLSGSGSGDPRGRLVRPGLVGRLAQDGPPADRARSAVEGLRAKDVDARRAAANRVRLAGRDAPASRPCRP